MKLIDILFRPMLAYPAEPFDSDEWAFEFKYDGTRTLTFFKDGKWKFINRRLYNFAHRYPEINIREAIRKEAILDGEIIVINKGKVDFRLLQSREQTDNPLKIEILSQKHPATYIVFDILWLDGKDLTKLPWEKRREILENNVSETDRIKVSPFVVGEGKALFQKAIEMDMEGIMAKKLDSPYLINKRSHYWLKIKKTKTIDCVILGYTRGEGKRKETFGALLLGVYDNNKIVYIGKVGTGWSETEARTIKEMLDRIKTKKYLDVNIEAVWVKPIYVCEVKYMEITSDMKLRAPSFVRLRLDKDAKECTLESLR